jgi:hypothetical protein
MNSYSVATSDCPSFSSLKALSISNDGSYDSQCQAEFKMVFQPTPAAYFVPYVSIRFTAIDDYNATSSSIIALLLVYELNQPPTIWAPANVVGGAGLNNLFIKDTSTGATANDPVAVGDSDSDGSLEQLTIFVQSGQGILSYPSTSPCVAAANQTMTWICTDTIDGFAQWLLYLRFNVTAGSSATLNFTINDLGATSSYKDSPHLTDSAITVVTLTAAVKAPSGSSSTLAIAIGVAAAAGLLLLGALGFFLRKKVSPPTDDYFAAATTPLSASPQSPLYKPQNQENFSPLYKAK